MNFYKNEKCIIFDESGNMGQNGRYFVISCIETDKYKSLYNIMHKKINIAKLQFPELNVHKNEIKAKDAYPAIKDHLLECIVRKDLKIHYIVADLKFINQKLLNDKNILYNYLIKILLDRILKDSNNKINIIFDNHSTKVLSTNSLFDYLKIFFIYEKGYNIDLNLQFCDSDSKRGYCIQAIDYVANAIYSKYEFNFNNYYIIISKRIDQRVEFPYQNFGK